MDTSGDFNLWLAFDRVTPHKDCVAIAQSDLLSGETKSAANTVCISEYLVKYDEKCASKRGAKP